MKQLKKIIITFFAITLLSLSNYCDIQTLQNNILHVSPTYSIEIMQTLMTIKINSFLYTPVFTFPQKNKLINTEKIAFLKNIGKKALLSAGIISFTAYIIKKIINLNTNNNQYNKYYRNSGKSWRNSIKNKCGSLLKKKPRIKLEIRF